MHAIVFDACSACLCVHRAGLVPTFCASVCVHAQVGCDGPSTWSATLAAVNPDVGFAPSAVLLSAYGYFDGTTRPDALRAANAHSGSSTSSSGGSRKVAVAYSTFCAGVSEVELDVLTGERRLLSCEMRYDCGYSLNPSIDLGQVGPSATG